MDTRLGEDAKETAEHWRIMSRWIEYICDTWHIPLEQGGIVCCMIVSSILCGCSLSVSWDCSHSFWRRVHRLVKHFVLIHLLWMDFLSARALGRWHLFLWKFNCACPRISSAISFSKVVARGLCCLAFMWGFASVYKITHKCRFVLASAQPEDSIIDFKHEKVVFIRNICMHCEMVFLWLKWVREKLLS